VNDQEIPLGKTRLTASVSERGEPVGSVRFEVNGSIVGSVNKPPFELEVDFSAYKTSTLSLTVTALSPSGQELTSQTIQARLYDPNKPAAATPVTSNTSTQTTPEPETPSFFEANRGLVIGGIAGLVVLIIIVVILATKRKKPEAEDEKIRLFDDSKTMDGINMAGLTTVKLEVLFSDDESMIGKTFDVLGFPYRVGRSSDNDLPLPKDSPVSRKHIVLEEDDKKITLREIITHSSDGQKKRPTYGTYVNGEKVGENEIVSLKNGDEIQIGTRVKVRFVRPQPVEPEARGDRTMDGLDMSGWQASLGQNQPPDPGQDIDRTTELS
jgi:hypothetical protein